MLAAGRLPGIRRASSCARVCTWAIGVRSSWLASATKRRCRASASASGGDRAAADDEAGQQRGERADHGGQRERDQQMLAVGELVAGVEDDLHDASPAPLGAHVITVPPLATWVDTAG